MNLSTLLFLLADHHVSRASRDDQESVAIDLQEITGTLGVLLRLHRIGLASRGIEEDLQLLEEAGMRISPDLRMRVIEAGRQDEGQPWR